MSNDLFAAARQEKCARLYARGWRQQGGKVHGVMMWLRPEQDGGGHVSEDEAFLFLERTKTTPKSPTDELQVQEQAPGG
mgnify:CR=1 FL=1